MKKNITTFHRILLLGVVVAISYSCKELPNVFEKSHNKEQLPTALSNNVIIKMLYKQISKKDFEIKILSKQIKSLSRIKIEREKFFNNKKSKTAHEETCYGIQLKVTQKTKRVCSLSIEQNKKKKPFIHCLKRAKIHPLKCKKWVQPLSFAKYCQKRAAKKERNESNLLTLPKGHLYKALLRVEMCKLDGKESYSLRQLKIDEEAPLLNAQRI